MPCELLQHDIRRDSTFALSLRHTLYTAYHVDINYGFPIVCKYRSELKNKNINLTRSTT